MKSWLIVLDNAFQRKTQRRYELLRTAETCRNLPKVSQVTELLRPRVKTYNGTPRYVH